MTMSTVHNWGPGGLMPMHGILVGMHVEKSGRDLLSSRRSPGPAPWCPRKWCVARRIPGVQMTRKATDFYLEW
jgi:hypothetical protein